MTYAFPAWVNIRTGEIPISSLLVPPFEIVSDPVVPVPPFVHASFEQIFGLEVHTTYGRFVHQYFHNGVLCLKQQSDLDFLEGENRIAICQLLK